MGKRCHLQSRIGALDRRHSKHRIVASPSSKRRHLAERRWTRVLCQLVVRGHVGCRSGAEIVPDDTLSFGTSTALAPKGENVGLAKLAFPGAPFSIGTHLSTFDVEPAGAGRQACGRYGSMAGSFRR